MLIHDFIGMGVRDSSITPYHSFTCPRTYLSTSPVCLDALEGPYLLTSRCGMIMTFTAGAVQPYEKKNCSTSFNIQLKLNAEYGYFLS